MTAAANMTCKVCGSLLSAVTFTCVRGEFCKPAANHMPFDEGAVTDAFQSVLGIPTLNKTTKAMCGKRVPVSQANHKVETTCSACLIVLTEKRKAEKRLREYLGVSNGSR